MDHACTPWTPRFDHVSAGRLCLAWYADTRPSARSRHAECRMGQMSYSYHRDMKPVLSWHELDVGRALQCALDVVEV